ncbi:MAG TPA: cation diffusion facilitator family transporter [Terriglobales bacterium]|nr:cation diffusion facilitator family transporter [Terriglobales bacterium]
MALVFGLTTTYMLAEGITGFLTGSLALVADAGHMLTDAGALGLALLAMSYAERPATHDKTFGFYRAEVLAAFSNAAILLLISIYILYEAIRRFAHPPEITSTPMLVVASLGLVINLVGMRLLASSSDESFNAKAAYLEVLSDALGSIGVIAAAIIMKTTGWYLADPIFGAAIGLFIIPRTIKMLKDTAHVLMEGTPSDISPEAVQQEMLKLAGVVKVHDFHLWTLASGVHSVTCHVCVENPKQGIGIMTELRRMLKDQYGISHATIQIEDQECRYGDLDF